MALMPSKWQTTRTSNAHFQYFESFCIDPWIVETANLSQMELELFLESYFGENGLNQPAWLQG